jgi:hypothetical protein
MPSLPAPLRRLGGVLAGHVRRLRAALEALAAQVRAALARAVGRATGDAVQDALRLILDGPPLERAAARDPPAGDDGLWGAPAPAPWRRIPPRDPWRQDPYDPYDDPEGDAWDGREPPDAEPQMPEPPAPVAAGAWSRAVAVGCQASAWWLRRHPGRFALVAALGVGVAAGAAALVGGPSVAGASAAMAAAVGVLALADAARAAALADTALN